MTTPPNKQHLANAGNTNEAALLVKIEYLECALRQKNDDLERSQKEQTRLRKQLNDCIETIKETSTQINFIGNELKNTYWQILGRVEGLGQDIKALECSNKSWSNRALKLQLGMLTVQNEADATKAGHDTAISRIALLEKELKDFKAEYYALRMQGDKHKEEP